MPDFIERGDGKPHVIYQRTSAAEMRNGVTVLTSGNAMRVIDDTGKELGLPGRARDLRLPLTCHNPPCFGQAGVMAVT